MSKRQACFTGFRHRYWFRLLVYTIERCGPVYVKLGQWAATRRDLFPQEMCEQLAKLQRHAQIHDWDHTQRVLERVLGGEDEVNQVFLQFDRKPIGSGCCAQVRTHIDYFLDSATNNAAVFWLKPI